MPNEHTEYTGEVDVPVEAIQAIDPNVVASKYRSFFTSYLCYSLLAGSTEGRLARPLCQIFSYAPSHRCIELPAGTQVTGITAHGASFWTRTARLDAESDGIPKEYFLKVEPSAAPNKVC
jgi:protein-ribulosamine 3-kinase